LNKALVLRVLRPAARSHSIAKAASASASSVVRARSTVAVAAAASGGNDAGASAPPSRGVLILPGLGNNAGDYADLAARLRARGLAVAVAPIARPDWARNAAALTDPAWWRGALKPRPAVDWYLERVSAAMDALKREVDGVPVTMLTHSVRLLLASGCVCAVCGGGWVTEQRAHSRPLSHPLPPPPKTKTKTRPAAGWAACG
jgi:predicted dienelactone hydrolase